MGGGCYHMNGYQKAYQDWIGGCNVVKATTSGTFTIYPLEKACNGVQLLQVPFPEPRTMSIGGQSAALTSYYVELRAPIGRHAVHRSPQNLPAVTEQSKQLFGAFGHFAPNA